MFIMVVSSVFLVFPSCVYIFALKPHIIKSIMSHNLHKDRKNKLCTLPLHMTMDCLDNLLLLRWLHADGLERLPGAAVRADKRFVVLSGKRRSAVVDPAAK